MSRMLRQRDPWLVGACIGAVLVGGLAGRSPVLAVAAVATVALALSIIYSPTALLGVLVVSNAVRWSDVPLPLMSSVFLLQKALLFVVLARLLWRRRGTWFGAAPLGVLTLGAAYTWVLSTPIPGLSVSQTVQSWATLVLVWLAVSLTLTRTEWQGLLKVIAWVPAVSVVVGVGLVAAGVFESLFLADATGASRLAGATIPAYLAATGSCAVLASALLARERAVWSVVAVLNIGIVLATSGRGAIIFVLLGLLPYLFSLLLSARRSGSARILTTAGLGVGLAVVVGVFLPVILSRTETSSGLNSSGRLEAWQFFLGQAAVNPLFGRGLGAGPLASAFAPKGVLPDTFVAQHSEYVRLILELGLVGIVMFAVAMVVGLGRLIVVAWSRGNGWIAATTVLGFLVYSGTDNTLTDFQFGVPVGLLLGAMAALRRSERPAAGRTATLARPGERQFANA